jgi:hypothetical protein
MIDLENNQHFLDATSNVDRARMTLQLLLIALSTAPAAVRDSLQMVVAELGDAQDNIYNVGLDVARETAAA